jgi:hypothetical protein
MYEKIEKELSTAKIDYDNIDISDKIDEYIKVGMEKGKASKKIKKKRNIINIAACLMFVCFITLIRVSPTFAATLSKVPVLKYIVQLINYDKGLKSAVENEFIQHIGVSDEHNGIVFTVDDVIIDEERMIIFYTIENKEDDYFVELYGVDVKDKENEYLNACLSYGWVDERDEHDSSKSHGKISISFTEESTIPEIFIVEPILIKSQREDGCVIEVIDENEDKNRTNQKNKEFEPKNGWHVEFLVDKSRFENMKQIYNIDKTVDIEGQKITFKSIAISPTRSAVKVEFDSSNTKKIFSFENLKLVDENREEWAPKGVTAAFTGENTRTLYFESNYFTEPKELYLKGSSFYALDKDKLKFKVRLDLENKKLLDSSQNLIEFVGMKNMDKSEVVLKFLINRDVENYKYSFGSLFDSEFEDGIGTKYNIDHRTCSMKTSEHGDDIILNIYIKANEKYKSPLTFTLNNYPTRIKKEFKIRIK